VTAVAEAPPLLELRGASKRFGAVQALRGVDFTVRRGEVVALVGDNGAGKSTLVKVLAGAHRLDDGELRFEGRAVSLAAPRDSRRLGIATVFQDLALCENLDVVANLFLGRERFGGPFNAPGLIDEARMEAQAVELLDGLSVRLPSIRARVAALSGGQRQSVAIARSLLGEPKLVLLDEPTAALGVAQTRQVLDLVGRLRERDLGVVLISHNLADVFEVADRIFVLRLGAAHGEFERRAATPEQVVAAITGAASPLVAELATAEAGR
jgi:D-xylose transport system ATP-binding protein